MVDEMTQLISASFDGRTIVYHFRVTEPSDGFSGATSAQLKMFMEVILPKRNCELRRREDIHQGRLPVVYAYHMPGDMEDMSVNLECEGRVAIGVSAGCAT